MNLTIIMIIMINFCEFTFLMITGVFLAFMLFIQYMVLSLGVIKENLKWYGYLLAWVPFSPYIVALIIIINFLIMKFLYNFIKWFEINLGWFFVNGRKRDRWGKYLREKYYNEK